MKLDLFDKLAEALTVGTLAADSEREKVPAPLVVRPANGFIRFEMTRGEFGDAIDRAERILFSMNADMDGAVLMDVDFYRRGAEKRAMEYNFRILPARKVTVDMEFSYLDSHSFFFEPTPGILKAQCAGLETRIEEVDRITFTIHSPHASYFNDVTFYGLEYTDEVRTLTVPGDPMVDEMGQWIDAEFANKTSSVEEMVTYLRGELEASERGLGYPEGFSRFGGCKELVFDRTGWFHTVKKEDRWYLVDPEGYGYFCNAVNYGSRMGVHGFVDGMRNLFSWLPAEDDPEFKDAWTYASSIPEFVKRNGLEAGRRRRMFNFARANMIRAFGGDRWWDCWCRIHSVRLKSWGYNAINVGVNNYEDENVHEYLKRAELPYVWTLKHFPLTKKRVFRDFSDVFSAEYQTLAAEFAREQLAPFKEDPWLIGYFITNEPEWRFEDTNLAERTFASGEDLVCRTVLIEKLREKYGTIDALNSAWASDFACFEALEAPVENLLTKYPEAKEDLDALHVVLVNRYEAVVCDALKKEDPHHLDLGMRYSQAGSAVMGGASLHDLFSFNCYYESPLPSLEGSGRLLDMPMIIGEWQIGCDNNGKMIGGLLTSENPDERGKAIANYMMDAITNKNCVGLAYFEYNDQPLLGRFDGECMQHGLIDVCSRPYEETVRYIRETGRSMYELREGRREAVKYQAVVRDKNGHNEMF